MIGSNRRAPWLRVSWLLLLLLVPAQARAQSREFLKGGGGFFGVGVRAIDLRDLNATLRQFGYTRFHQPLTMVGGGGYAMRNRVMLGGEFYGWTGQRRGPNDMYYSTRLDGGFGIANLGYLLTPTERVNLYPMIGLGGAGMSVQIDERSSPSFHNVMENPGRSSTLGKGALIGAISLGTDYLLTMRRTPTHVTGLTVGMRAGYTSTLFESEWNLRGHEIAGGPEVSLNGFFMTFTVGARRQTMPAYLASSTLVARAH